MNLAMPPYLRLSSKPWFVLAWVISFGLSSVAHGQAFYRNVINVSGGVGSGGLYKIKETKTDTTGGAKNTVSRTVGVNTLDPNNGNVWGLSFEYGYAEWRGSGGLGVGVYLGTRKFIYRDLDMGPIFSEKSLRFYIINLETRYHFYTKSRWDPYITSSVGLQLQNAKYLFTKNVRSIDENYKFMPEAKPLASYAAAAGARYFFANNMAVFAEAGFGYYYAKAGINLIVRRN